MQCTLGQWKSRYFWHRGPSGYFIVHWWKPLILRQMIVGYLVENILGFILAASLFDLKLKIGNSRGTRIDHLSTVFTRSCSAFFDCAIFFTFSIQVASIVVLARLDFGISASGMGDSTAKITWAVSLLTLLPLVYVALVLNLLMDKESRGRELERAKSKESLRFLLFTVCWLLSIYPFFSKMIGYFGPSLIGNGPGNAISDKDWDTIEKSCTQNVKEITQSETTAMAVFGVTGSLTVSIATITKIIWLGAQRQHGNSKFVASLRKRQFLKSSWVPITIFIVIPILGISQLWTILRVRQFQMEIARNAGNTDADGQWTFGQVAAVTVFVPVAVEAWFSWHYGGRGH